MANTNSKLKTSKLYLESKAQIHQKITVSHIFSETVNFFLIFQQHDINDANGTIVTLENGQTYQLPQYHMGATIFQRGEDLVGSF